MIDDMVIGSFLIYSIEFKLLIRASNLSVSQSYLLVISNLHSQAFLIRENMAFLVADDPDGLGTVRTTRILTVLS